MLSFMSDRRVLSVSAALITAAIFLFLLGTYPSWRAAIRDGISWSDHPTSDAAPSAVQTPAEPARLVAPSPVAMPNPSTGIAPQSQAPVPANDAAPQPSPPAPAPDKASSFEPSAPGTAVVAGAAPARGAAGPILAAATNATVPATATPSGHDTGAAAPTFDIVRVEPTGDSVVAARAKAGASVVLLDEGRPIARVQADSNGQVAFVPPALAPGEHSLMLSVGEPNSPGALSSQSVAVSVPQEAKAPPMVALIQPDQPTRILSEGAPSTTSPGAAPAPGVSVSSMDVEDMGSVFATGRAAPGSHCRVYLNGSFVAPVTAGPDGKWSLKIQRGMRPGHYDVRVDQIGSADGHVQARAEVPFDYPASLDRSVSLLRPKPGTAANQATTASRNPAVAAKEIGRQGVNAPGPAAQAKDAGESMAAAKAGGTSQTGTPAEADRLASAAPSSDAASAPADTAAPTVVAQLLTTKVVRGDSLWRISRKMLGHGRHYTQIYAVNTSQIRDPRLIYPGQIFVMPQGATAVQ